MIRRGDSGPKQSEDDFTTCEYHPEKDELMSKIVFDCKECRISGSLLEKKCLAGVLNALSREYSVDAVVLSDYIETQYGGVAMELLNNMLRTDREMARLSARDPSKLYSGGRKSSSQRRSKEKLDCAKCKLNPSKMFPTLRKLFVEDISKFYEELRRRIDFLRQGPAMQECHECTSTTNSDLSHLINTLEDLKAFVFLHGYRVPYRRNYL